MLRGSRVVVEALEVRRFLSASVYGAGLPGAAVAAAGISASATPMPSEGGLALNAIAHKSFTARLGEVTLKVIDLQLNASIDWGDGSHSDGKLIGSYATGEYYVEGTHTYARDGTYKVEVKIFAHPIGSPILPTGSIAAFTSVINVKEKS